MSKNKEIERKFLVNIALVKKAISGIKKIDIIQGYIPTSTKTAVRVRTWKMEHKEPKAFLTLKGVNHGIERPEYEYPIPHEDGLEMMDTICEGSFIVKERFAILVAGKLWEVDFFLEENTGLVVAEIELKDKDEKFILPEWALEEVSDNPKYYNVNLVDNPFCNW